MNRVEATKRLHKDDFEIATLRAKIAKLDGAQKELEDGIAKMNGLKPKVVEGLSKAQAVVRSAEHDVQVIEERRAKLKSKLSLASSAKAANAVQSEINGVDEKIAAAEEIALTALEKEEEAQGMVEKVDQAVVTLNEKLKKHLVTKDQEVSQLETEIASLTDRREQWRAHMEPEDLALYDALHAERAGKKFVTLIEDACTLCDHHFRSDLLQTYMNHCYKPHECPGCGAIMIYEGAVGLAE